MISLGAISRNIMYRQDAAKTLAGHPGYKWNKAQTRIRCSGAACEDILDVPAGPDSGEDVIVFARHQADHLPDVEPTTVPDPEPETTPEPADLPEQNLATEPGQDPEPAGEEPMEQALSEAALAAADPTTAPKTRRDTKALTAMIEEIKKGDRVSATFSHPRYGMFTVEGTVIKGGAGQDRNQLMVAGWHLNLNARAAKHLHGLTILAPAGKHEFAIPKPSELTEHVGIGN